MTQPHWASRRERGSYWLMKFTFGCSRLLGRRLISPLLYGIVLYFYLSGRQARRHAFEYQSKLARYAQRSDLAPTSGSVFAQFMSFADSLLDKLDVWHGRLSLRDIEVIDPDRVRPNPEAPSPRGQMLVGAHLGNLEVCRAMADQSGRAMLNVLVHTKHATQFNRLLNESGANNLRLIQVSELDAATMLQLSQRIDAGEWLAIAGDRVPLQGERNVEVDFLGDKALLPQGPWLLAGLLECQVNLIFCLKQGKRYQIILEHFTDKIVWTRRQRMQVIQEHAQRYAARLEHYCLQAPLQWFNFFAFWKSHDNRNA